MRVHNVHKQSIRRVQTDVRVILAFEKRPGWIETRDASEASPVVRALTGMPTDMRAQTVPATVHVFISEQHSINTVKPENVSCYK